MTEEEFIKSIDPIPDHDYLYFVPVDWTLGTEATSRAYIHFLNPEDVIIIIFNLFLDVIIFYFDYFRYSSLRINLMAMYLLIV